jgi:hypothetical protein
LKHKIADKKDTRDQAVISRREMKIIVQARYFGVRKICPALVVISKSVRLGIIAGSLYHISYHLCKEVDRD